MKDWQWLNRSLQATHPPSGDRSSTENIFTAAVARTLVTWLKQFVPFKKTRFYARRWLITVTISSENTLPLKNLVNYSRSIYANSSLIYAVTVNYKRPQDTIECLDSLMQQEKVHLHIVVVDNGSQDVLIH